VARKWFQEKKVVLVFLGKKSPAGSVRPQIFSTPESNQTFLKQKLGSNSSDVEYNLTMRLRGTGRRALTIILKTPPKIPKFLNRFSVQKLYERSEVRTHAPGEMRT
jgi:hypothetical protein